MKKFIVFIVIIFQLLGCENKNTLVLKNNEFKISNVINTGYLEYLKCDSFPLNIAEYALNISYFANDTLVFNKLVFPTIDYCINNDIDTTLDWNLFDIPDFRIIPTKVIRNCYMSKNCEYFKNNIGRGLIIVSRPIIDISLKYALIKEQRIFCISTYNYEFNESYLIFKKESGCWKLFDSYQNVVIATNNQKKSNLPTQETATAGRQTKRI